MLGEHNAEQRLRPSSDHEHARVARNVGFDRAPAQTTDPALDRGSTRRHLPDQPRPDPIAPGPAARKIPPVGGDRGPGTSIDNGPPGPASMQVCPALAGLGRAFPRRHQDQDAVARSNSTGPPPLPTPATAPSTAPAFGEAPAGLIQRSPVPSTDRGCSRRGAARILGRSRRTSGSTESRWDAAGTGRERWATVVVASRFCHAGGADRTSTAPPPEGWVHPRAVVTRGSVGEKPSQAAWGPLPSSRDRRQRRRPVPGATIGPRSPAGAATPFVDGAGSTGSEDGSSHGWSLTWCGHFRPVLDAQHRDPLRARGRPAPAPEL